MKIICCLLSLVVAVFCHNCVQNTYEDFAPLKAVVLLHGPESSLAPEGIHGNVTFIKLEDNSMKISGIVEGLPAGMYGFHVHEYGDTRKGCVAAGGHYNPHMKDHGHPEDENRHVGDLGNIVSDENKVSIIEFTDKLISLSGKNSIVGRAVVIHERADDFGRTDHPDSKKTGNAGGRVACGVIGISP